MSDPDKQYLVDEAYDDGTLRAHGQGGDVYLQLAVDDTDGELKLYARRRTWEGEPEPPPEWLAAHSGAALALILDERDQHHYVT